MTPHLGKHYALQWAQEDGANMDISDSDALMTKLPSGSEEDYKQIDGAVFPGDIEFGTLWPRLLSALIQDPTSAGSYCLEEGNQYPASPTKFDMAGLEERLRRELRYIGIITDKDVMMDDDHCDEISIDLKKAQKQLRLQMEENDFMKEKLLVVAQEWVGWQEYNALLDDVNKQIEQFYDKKFVHYCR